MNATTRPIHCLLDCFASVVKEDGQFDYRPLYIGIWNDSFGVTEQGIYYYSDASGRIDWPDRFNQLYGNSLTLWFSSQVSKPDNLLLMCNLAGKMTSQEVIIIRVDVHYLPYCQHYQAKHTPHFLIIDYLDGDQWHIRDPYFGWEGYLDQDTLWNAFGFMGSTVGYLINRRSFNEPDRQTVSLLMKEEAGLSSNRLAAEVETFVQIALQQNEGCIPKSLFASIEQVGVISKRLYGYLPVLSYFSETDIGDGKPYSGQTSELVKGWESLMLSIARLGILGREADLRSIKDKLRRVEGMEAVLRRQLADIYGTWAEKYGLQNQPRRETR